MVLNADMLGEIDRTCTRRAGLRLGSSNSADTGENPAAPIKIEGLEF